MLEDLLRKSPLSLWERGRGRGQKLLSGRKYLESNRLLLRALTLTLA